MFYKVVTINYCYYYYKLKFDVIWQSQNIMYFLLNKVKNNTIWSAICCLNSPPSTFWTILITQKLTQNNLQTSSLNHTAPSPTILVFHNQPPTTPNNASISWTVKGGIEWSLTDIGWFSKVRCDQWSMSEIFLLSHYLL